MAPRSVKNDGTSEASWTREPPPDLTVCDIIGAWGAYQWSLLLYAILYSALVSVTVCVGPIWTLDIRHHCAPPQTPPELATNTTGQPTPQNFDVEPYQCTLPQPKPKKLPLPLSPAAAGALEVSIEAMALEVALIGEASSEQVTTVECRTFVYDDAEIGKVLTNTFDLVCSRQRLRSLISSASLTGMLLSSITLGLVSDKYGRVNCMRVGHTMSLLSTVAAIFVNDYFLLCVCFLIMSYAQVGVGNSLCTLVMEATTPSWRSAAVFEYSLGWGLGLLAVPYLQVLTRDYQYYLAILLFLQIIMLVWFKFGIFESIRWLLSESKINRAQIELQRACRWNRVKPGARLANKIAQMQAQQVRKASSIIEQKTAPARLARAMHQEPDDTRQELSLLTTAIRRSLVASEPGPRGLADALAVVAAEQANETDETDQTPPANRAHASPRHQSLSPTLARNSFSLTTGSGLPVGDLEPNGMVKLGNTPSARSSITAQGLAQLALKYSRTLQKQEEGVCFFTGLFNRQLWRSTIVLMMLSVMLETSYFGFIQAHSFVGHSMELNYVSACLTDVIGSIAFMVIAWGFSRRVALVGATALGSLACFAMALSYQMIPDKIMDQHVTNITTNGKLYVDDADLADMRANLDEVVLSDTSAQVANETHAKLLADSMASNQRLLTLRETINFWIMLLAKLMIGVALQMVANITMETFPNSLRQTGLGFISFMGRIGSILAPVLFIDPSPNRLILKITLVALGSVGLLGCILVPCTITDTKHLELADCMYEVGDYEARDIRRRRSRLESMSANGAGT